MSREWEDKPQTEKLFTRDISVKGNVPNIYKELIKLNSKKADNLFQKYVKDLNRELTREDKQMTNNHMKGCFISYQGNAN